MHDAAHVAPSDDVMSGRSTVSWAAILLAVSTPACTSDGDSPRPSPATTVATTTESVGGGSELATWSLPAGAAISGSSESFTVQVTRDSCNNGVTGVVSRPSIDFGDTEVVVTFSVEPTTPGTHTCQMNPAVDVAVSMGEPIGDRLLIDGGCRDSLGPEASSCIRWRP